MPSLASFLVPIGFAQFIVALVFFVIFPFPANLDSHAISFSDFGAGLCNAFALIILLNSLQRGEVSRVIPVASSSPIFVALLSMPLLGEMLNYWQWLAVVLTVSGAVLVSLHHDGGGEKTRLQKSFFLLLFAALLSAISSIGYKYALETMSFWNMFSINEYICVVVVVSDYFPAENDFLGTEESPAMAAKNRQFSLATRRLLSIGVVDEFYRDREWPGGARVHDYEYQTGICFCVLTVIESVLSQFHQ